MSLQHHLPDQVRADPWMLFCAECSQTMRIMTASPAQEGREIRRYACACGHSERIDLAIGPETPHSGCVPSSQHRRYGFSHAPDQRPQAIPPTKDRHDRLEASVSDTMLAAVPSLRAFAISLSGKVDRADDLVQETLLRAIN